MRSHKRAGQLLGRGIGFAILSLALFCLVSESNAINARLERPNFIFELRDFVGYIMPKKDGQVPVGSTGVDIGPSLVFETIPGDTTQLMNFRDEDAVVDLMVSSTVDVLPSGIKVWRWKVLSQLLENPASFNDVFLQVYEIFESDTTARLYGGSEDIPVNSETVYYSQSIDLSHWNASVFCTGFRVVTWVNLYTEEPASALRGYQSPIDVRHELDAPEFSFQLFSFPFADVDGVKTAAGLTDYLVDGAMLTYASVQNVPLPTNAVVQHFRLKVSSGVDARLVAPVKLPTEGYKKSAIAVGVVFGILALAVIAGFATYFFCLKQWMPVWHVLSVPGRYVSGRVRLWTRPPAPTFHEEDTELEEEDDPLNAERVDAEQLMKLTAGAVGVAASAKHSRQGSGSSDNVLARLRKAMGRRLSNFVGWDGPPPGSSTPSDRSPSPSKKDKKDKKNHARTPSSSSTGHGMPHIITPEMMPHLVELEGSSGSNLNLNVQMYASRANDSDSAVGLLTDRDESPSPIRPGHGVTAAVSSTVGSTVTSASSREQLDHSSVDSGDELDSSHDASSRSSAPLRGGGREFPSGDEPPRNRKPGGLRHFKITGSQTSITTDVVSPASTGSPAPLLSPPTSDTPTSSTPSDPSSPEHQRPDDNESSSSDDQVDSSSSE